MGQVLKMSPRKVTKVKDICAMQSDNFDADHHWILTDMRQVTITAQEAGYQATGSITIPRKTFDKLVDWYMKEQTIRPVRKSR